jgi:hypothetical protein
VQDAVAHAVARAVENLRDELGGRAAGLARRGRDVGYCLFKEACVVAPAGFEDEFAGGCALVRVSDAGLPGRKHRYVHPRQPWLRYRVVVKL